MIWLRKKWLNFRCTDPNNQNEAPEKWTVVETHHISMNHHVAKPKLRTLEERDEEDPSDRVEWHYSLERYKTIRNFGHIFTKCSYYIFYCTPRLGLIWFGARIGLMIRNISDSKTFPDFEGIWSIPKYEFWGKERNDQSIELASGCTQRSTCGHRRVGGKLDWHRQEGRTLETMCRAAGCHLGNCHYRISIFTSI